jgi:hypothetical protein
MIISAKIPRWWQVTPAQMHWLALHLRYGRALVAEAAIDPAVRTSTLESLARLAPPRRARHVELLLHDGNVAQALDEITPAEFFALAVDMLAKRKDDSSLLASEIRRMAAADPTKLTYAEISTAFGTPKPTLANSYRPELLRLRTFPTLMGYSSRIMAESWESNTLYWADLADAAHYRPSQLNHLVPTWTQKVVERIFASHLEDWPALLRSLRMVGGTVQQDGIQRPETADAAALR